MRPLALESSQYKNPARWKHVRQVHQSFWKRWQHEYLHTLQTRAKWTRPSKPLDVGEVVLLTSNSCNPLHWPMGRIEKLLPGPDGVARVAVIKTKQRIYTRPVSKLIPLPVT